METVKCNRLFLLLTTLLISTAIMSYSKSIAQSDNHVVDERLVGKWMWTKSSDGAYYNNSGVYQGSAYGLAIQYNINADGTGSCFNHIQSTIGAGTSSEVNISSVGFFESDNQGHLGYFPTGGTYKSSSGTNRTLRPDELWDTEKNTGKSFIHQKLVFKKINGRQCFEVTSNDGVTDRFWKVE